MSENKVTRRGFIKQTGSGVLTASLIATQLAGKNLSQYVQSAPDVNPRDVVAALGDTLIPTEEPDYPGYRRLEEQGISDEVFKALQGIPAQDFSVFNAVSQDLLGKTFLDLEAKERAAYIDFVASTFPPETFGVTDAGQKAKAVSAQGLDQEVVALLQRVFRLCRARILTVFYQNFPYHTVKREKKWDACSFQSPSNTAKWPGLHHCALHSRSNRSGRPGRRWPNPFGPDPGTSDPHRTPHRDLRLSDAACASR